MIEELADRYAFLGSYSHGSNHCYGDGYNTGVGIGIGSNRSSLDGSGIGNGVTGFFACPNPKDLRAALINISVRIS